MKCTWENCTRKSSVQMKSKDGSIWAEICNEHEQMIDEAIRNSDPKKILSYWIKAQGGAIKAVKRM